LKDEASANYYRSSGDRKEKRDRTFLKRDFKICQKVWYRTPGLSETLQLVWQGPYLVDKVLGDLSYRIDMDGKFKNVHVKFLKEDVSRMIKRITTVLEYDVEGDDVTCTNGKVKMVDIVPTATMQAAIDSWLADFQDVVCSEPELTDWVELSINTGDAPPVSQRLYNTPVALREAVAKEVDWLNHYCSEAGWVH